MKYLGNYKLIVLWVPMPLHCHQPLHCLQRRNQVVQEHLSRRICLHYLKYQTLSP
uniref:Uncharacterized protein n=1 Tax=Arundo donax TaxID=35708 RepID=A0A0A9GX22_ARUDO